MGAESSGNTSYILDMTPETTSWYDPALEVGKSFSDPDAGVTITPLWANNSGAAVSVSLSSQPCLHVAPSISITPTQSADVPSGASVIYTVSITNNDATQCAASSFTLQANTPDAGWLVAFAAPVITLAPGASASTTLQITSPSSAVAGTYTVNVKASRNTSTGNETQSSATYTIAPPSTSEDISVATDKSSYVAREWVKTTARVRQNGTLLQGAKVVFTVKKPDGRTLKKTMATNKQGAAVFRFQLSQRDPVGTYRVTVQLNQANGGIAGFFTVAETNFSVQ